jgi:hypothetical protein
MSTSFARRLVPRVACPQCDGMDPLLAGVAGAQGGLFYRWQALECGYRSADVARLARREWHRVRRGAYVERHLWNSLDPAGRHLLMIRAVVGALGDDVVVSHTSAVVVHGLPVWGQPLDEVWVTRASDGSSRREGGVRHEKNGLSERDVTIVQGLRVTVPDRSVIDYARQSSLESGVVTADAALHRGLVDQESLLDTLEQQRDWPGSVTARRAVQFANPRAESVGESRSRFLFAELGLPSPKTQVTIRDETGQIVGRVDFLFLEECTVGEFDGRMKYGRALAEPNAEPMDPGEVVYREKLREEALRDLGYEVGRLVWADLEYARQAVGARFRRAFARAARR